MALTLQSPALCCEVDDSFNEVVQAAAVSASLKSSGLRLFCLLSPLQVLVSGRADRTELADIPGPDLTQAHMGESVKPVQGAL